MPSQAKVRARASPDECGLKASFAVFASRGFEEGFGGVGGIGILEALSLSDGVVREDGEAVAGEGAGEGVVTELAGEAMAGGYYRWKFFLCGAGFCIGEVEEGRDGEVGLGFVEDLFDAEAVGLRGAERFCVEGCFFGEPADEGQDFLADFALAGFGLGSGGDGSDGGAASGRFFDGNVVEVVSELRAADVRRGVGVWSGRSRYRRTLSGGCRGRLRGEKRGGKKCRGGDEIEDSHRAALIHPDEEEVKRWSYQFSEVVM